MTTNQSIVKSIFENANLHTNQSEIESKTKLFESIISKNIGFGFCPAGAEEIAIEELKSILGDLSDSF